MSKENGSFFKRHKILTAIGVIVLLAIIGGAAGGGNKTGNNSSTTNTNETQNAEQAKTESKPAMAKIGEPARDGKFEFTVKSVECGKTSVGTNQYLTKTPQGQYCFMAVSVKNIGDQAQSLFSANQKLLNAQNQQYAADDTATLYAAPNGSSWYSNINPGNSVEGIIVFDIPKDQTPVTAELHDSAYSGGVKVSLQ